MKLTRLLMLIFLPMLLFGILAIAQDQVVTGKVTNAKDGSPMGNVTLQVKGTKIATQTNPDGTFKLKIPAGSKVIIFTYVGYGSKEVAINGSVFNVALEETNAALNEVVVVGYGTQQRREVTGAIAKISSDKINSIAAPSFEAALQGKAAGVQVIQGSGLAGSGSVVRVRGISSISASGDPLYVVDGIPIITDPFLRGNNGAQNQNPLASINPNDIESIEVLKDAGAAGIYGSRGANGVILITTKRSKSGKLQINYNNKVGISTYANKPDFLNTNEWLQLRQEAWENDGNTGKAPLPGQVSLAQAQATNTDWWGDLTRTGFINEHNISLQGGKKIKSYVGLTYSDNQSYLKDNAYTRYGVRGNFDYAITSKLKASLNLAYNLGINKRVPAAWSGGLGDAMSTALPFYPVYNADGTYFTAGSNPVRRLNETKWRNYDNRLLSGLTLEYTPVKDLTLKAVGSYENVNSIDHQYESANWAVGNPKGVAKSNPYWGYNYSVSTTANYNYNINPNNKLTFLLGFEAQEARLKKYSGDIYSAVVGRPFWEDRSAYKFAKDSLLNSGSRVEQDLESQSVPLTFVSYFSRITYNLKNKYYFQVLARIDGSSKFGTNNKYGFFPAASAAWTLSEESFFKNIKWINFLKLRTSFGLTGNSNITAGSYYSGYYIGNNPYLNNTTLYPSAPGNPDLRWETTNNFDLGLDFTLFKSRITGEISYYNKQAKDILLSAGLSNSTGFKDQMRNIDGSSVVNEGVELTLNLKVVDTKDFKWSIGGNISRNYNELKSLGTLSPDAAGGGTNDTRVAIGFPIGTNYLVRYYGVDPNDGLPIWYDINGKLTKTFSLNNRLPVGKVVPDFMGGANTSFSYKNWDISALFTYVIGGNIYDGAAKRQLGIVTDWNMRRDIMDRWRKPGDIAKYPRLTMSTNTYDGLSSEWQYNSTMFLYDASYVRLRELSIAYRIPTATCTRWGLKNARLFITGMNLLTFTKYPGGDPEIARDFENAQDRNLSPNVSYLTPPQQKSLIVGVNISL